MRLAIVGFVMSLIMLPAALAGALPVNAAANVDQWATICSVPGLDYADTNTTDKSDTGGPVVIRPDKRGHHIPIVMVHGLTGNSKHNNYDDKGQQIGSFSKPIDLATFQETLAPRPSLIGVLQNIAGAAVYTFDYHDLSARWVTDPGIGQNLAKSIDCLYRQSGEKVIVVAHSMGGLATRQAMTAAGLDISSKVSQVIEFGTPNAGSDIASFLNTLHAISPAFDDFRGGWWLKYERVLLALCGADATRSVVAVEKNGCGGEKDVPMFVASLRSEAGLALATGSPDLKILPAIPAAVPVHSLSGDIQIENKGSRFFRQKYADSESPLASQTATSLGDQIVSLASSQAGSSTQDEATCLYDFFLDVGPEDMPIMPTISASTNGRIRDLNELKMSEPRSPCFHGNLMQSITLAAKAAKYISSDIRSRQVVDLQSLNVPAMCHRPAGVLSGGVLVSGAVGQKTVIAASAAGSPDEGGDVGAAVALRCSGGGGVFPDVVALYGFDGSLLGSVDLGRPTYGIPGVDSLEVQNNVVITKWTNRIVGAYDPRAAPPVTSASGAVRWDGHDVTIENR